MRWRSIDESRGRAKGDGSPRCNETRGRHSNDHGFDAVPVSPAAREVAAAALSDLEVIGRVKAGNLGLFERSSCANTTSGSIARPGPSSRTRCAEDVLQQAYLNAFAHLNQFEARAQLSTWLTRIIINEATARRRRAARAPSRPGPAGAGGESEAAPERVASAQPDPEHQAYALELRRILEDAIDGLPESYRLVFGDVEGLSTSETGLGLGLGDRAIEGATASRARDAAAGGERANGSTASATFEFHAPRCNRIVARVLGLLAERAAAEPGG